ncbi:MAG: Rpn family recombination-promoting nuclease/putative transposase [Micrococcales bacterium]|nr:Rpn family recombination-promoting nuclease/putative transposase [Micrococcales bacterium]
MNAMSVHGADQDRRTVPLYYDTVFRWLFGSVHNRRLLGAFLHAALPELPAAEWTGLTLPDTHLLGTAEQKDAVLDVLVATSTQRSVDVEIQMANVPAVRDRFVFYNSRQVADQLSRGRPYTMLRPVVTLVICGFVLFEDDEDYVHTIEDYDVAHHKRFTDLRQIRILELPKLPVVDDGTDLWDWLRLIAAETEEEIDMAAANNPDVAQAAVLVKEFSADETRRWAALSREKFLRDQVTRETVAREEGRQEEIRRAAERRHQDIRQLAAVGVSVGQVATAFGITPDEVAAIIAAG